MRRIMSAAFAAVCLIGSPLVLSADKPIATTDGEAPGITLQVTQFKVSNGTVMLKFTIVNDGKQRFDHHGTLADQTVAHPDYDSISGVYLIDVANKKKYLVMYDSASLCVCSRDFPDVAAQSSENFWAKFPAPPENVQKIGIVVPHFAPLDDVPLSR